MTTWRFLLFFLAITVPDRVSSQVVINEVYYDHPGSDAGFEFIELYCPEGPGVQLAGWSIVMIDGRTGSVRELWRAGPDRIIDSGGFILVGGDSCAVSAEDILTGSIENGPDAVALLRGGEEIDLVRFGGDDPSCTAGRSLSRRPDGSDTGDTSADLVCSLPTPGLRNFHARDLSVSFGGPQHVYCTSGRADIYVHLENVGFEVFSGDVLLTVSSEQDGFRSEAGRMRVRPSLNEGEGLDIRTSCYGLPAGISILSLAGEPDGDTNPLNDRVSATMSSSPGEVVITEIMYRPGRGGEWIELFNRAASSVDLSGWSVTDRSGASGSITGGVEIASGGFIILAQDPVGIQSEFPGLTCIVLALENGWPRLNDGDGEGTAEEIFVRGRDGTMMESVLYRSMIEDERGRSIERLSPELCSSDGSGIWLRCGAAAGGTPGERNYCHRDVLPAEGMIVSPDPFCPEMDVMVRFTAAAGADEDAYGARIFDVEGREVARLASGPVGACAVSFSWDGCDAGGKRVETGLYICVVEFTVSGGGVCRREKGTVAVWAGRR